MGARFTKEQAGKLTIIENRVKLRPTKSEIVQRLELEKLQERVKKASPPPVTPIKKRSKYGNRKTVVDGITFDSAKEAKRWGELKQMVRSGLINGLDRQRKYRFEHNGILIGSYIGDFAYWKRVNGVQTYFLEDVKSEMTRKLPVYRLKKKLMLAFFEIEITET